MPDIKWYISRLNEICKELDAAGMHFVSTAAKLNAAAAILREIAEDERFEQISILPKPPEEQATEAQLNYLRDLGVPFPLPLTKREASRLISEAEAKRA